VADTWPRVAHVVDGVLIRVADVDAHFRGSVELGATIVSEPEDAKPDRPYRVEDAESSRWISLQDHL
jgi:uncharacterized glyoxalase superfamily protein PhnB